MMIKEKKNDPMRQEMQQVDFIEKRTNMTEVISVDIITHHL
jgi:hypothetical protein